jgi:hypothetical protein
MNSSPAASREIADIFWAELSACDHCVQVYDTDDVFLDALEGFVAAGIRNGEAIVLIATPAHLQALESRLANGGFDVQLATRRGQYIALDARQTIATFMVDGWPDEALFFQVIDRILATAKANYPKVRAFGEMVAIMWEQGHCGATVRLEHLWTRLCEERTFPLFCAYPKTGFTHNAADAIKQICDAHSRQYPTPS